MDEGDNMSEDNLRERCRQLMVGEKQWTALSHRSVPTLLLCVLSATLDRIWPTDADYASIVGATRGSLNAALMR